jgi:sigma-B regulation protein RsbU (phosphoserine phosphatase)
MLARIDIKRRTLVYANAGHTPGYVLDGGGSVKKKLNATGLPLGLFPERSYKTSPEVRLAAGDLIVMTTDGVTETQDQDGNFFGEKRALQLVAAQRKMTSSMIVNNLFAAASEHASGHPQLDDITAVVCKITS